MIRPAARHGHSLFRGPTDSLRGAIPGTHDSPTTRHDWPTTSPPKANFRWDGDNDGGTDGDRDDDHEDGYDDEDNEAETSEVDEHQGFFRHVRKHRSPKTNNLFSDTGLCPSVGK